LQASRHAVWPHPVLLPQDLQAGADCAILEAKDKADYPNLLQLVRNLTMHSLFVWLVANGWCWFVLREKYSWLVAGGWFVLREKYCCLVADKPSDQGASL
jgi:hypothetical protein